ncbi:MAG: sugar-phosphate isomerase, RpiB/LacA/LacB family [Solirubrobacterales bacterium]|jgi:ribose 5-phosphate isomerase B|nr:sugar-phosphate isomerase, RpiB/LacA/LacB family [Solirubrobacterales bacterium]
MRIAVAFDHAGVPLRDVVLDAMRAAGHEATDLGTWDDYPDSALAAGEAVLDGGHDRAIVVCGSGAGVAVAACKLDGIRAACCHDTYTAAQCVAHDDVNVLCLGARVVGPAVADTLVRAFASATFSGEERHVRRLAQVAAIEASATPPSPPPPGASP